MRLTSVIIREVRQDSHASIGHVGLALITEMARVSGLDDLCREVTAMKQGRFPMKRSFVLTLSLPKDFEGVYYQNKLAGGMKGGK